MSLDYSFGKVANFKTLCIDESTESGLSRDTYALIWTALILDMEMIRVNNIDEWNFRYEFLERIGVSSGVSWVNEKGDIASYYPSYDAIADHLGLRMNVRQVPRTAWIRKIVKRVENETLDICKRMTEEREKKNGSDESNSVADSAASA